MEKSVRCTLSQDLKKNGKLDLGTSLHSVGSLENQIRSTLSAASFPKNMDPIMNKNEKGISK